MIDPNLQYSFSLESS